MRRHVLLAWTALVLNGVAAESNPLAQLQDNFLSWKFGLFLHFNVATFNNQEWANGYEDPATFAPDKLDCGQWADAALAAGMRYAVLTVKHTGGWCLWDSQATTHDMTAFTNYKQGKGDVVRDFTEAFRARGMKVGLYYCMPGNYAGKYGNILPEGKSDLHGLPPEAAGDYSGFIKKQFTELLTNYGPIDLLWIDQWGNGYTGKDWLQIKEHVKALQPNCLVLANNAHTFKQTDLYGFELPVYKGKRVEELIDAQNTAPTEVCDKLGPGWFWNEKRDETRLMSATEVVARLRVCNARRANYLLDVGPDTHGLLPELSAQRLKEIGKLLDVPQPEIRSAEKTESANDREEKGDWIQLFNGKDLNDWVVKLNHHPLNENYGNTFRVEDGLLKVRYDQYGDFGDRFGHLYYKQPFSNYHLAVEYRFVGSLQRGAPKYADLNNGVMFHAQDPKTILLDQNWPIALELQFLAGLPDGKPRPTGCVCTPGTHVVYNGTLTEAHIIQSSAETYPPGDWVRAEVIVHGSRHIEHIINGKKVLEYSQPQIGGGVVAGHDPKMFQVGKLLNEGFIGLQSEGQPVDFRKVEIKVLETK